ncbi:MAG: GGDEF domain-containing protein, partial [Gaiellaceae bacterium]
TSLIAQMIERKEVLRLVYNAAVYTVAGGVAGLAMNAVGGNDSAGLLVASAFVGSIVFWAVNIMLVIGAVSRVTRQRLGTLARSVTLETAIPAAIMASTAVMLVSLADSSPYLPLTLVGPLAAITLYQRTVHRSLSAMKLALTDSLTELGNYRHFCQKLDEYEEAAREPGLVLSLCLFDIDNFKTINDTHGHLTGDAALRSVAAAMRQDAEAFRIGGDEFALLLKGRSESEAREIAARIMARVATNSSEHGSVQLSAGLASYPQPGLHIADLVASADIALYASKHAGKNQISCYRPGNAMAAQGEDDRDPGLGVSRATGRDRPVRAA